MNDKLYARARAAEAVGKMEHAQMLYLQLYQIQPDYPNLNFRLGLQAFARAEHLAAEAYFAAELAVQPDFWACRAQLGLSLLARDKTAAAQQQFTKALQDCPVLCGPERAGLWRLLGRCLRSEGHLFEARQAFEQAQKIQSHPEHLRELAQLYQAQANFKLAAFYFQQTWAVGQRAQDLWALADHALMSHDYVGALDYFQLAARHPDLSVQQQALALGQIASCQQALNQPEAALETYVKAQAQLPLAAFELARVGVLPMVYRDSAEVLQWRGRSEQALSRLETQTCEAEDLLNWQAPPFYLAYQGYNDRDWLQRFSNQVRRRLPPLESGEPNRTPYPKVRIGLISRFFHHHSVMRCFAELFIQLAVRPPFELHLIAASSVLQDQTTARLRQVAASWTCLQGDLPAQAQQIQRLALDLLVYTDTLLDAQTYLLSHYRLAPVQCLLPGQPVTSGVNTLDYFISDQLTEPRGAQQHYTEHLLCLPHWPTLYARPDVSGSVLSRSTLGLPAGRLYLCSASVFKLHPQMDTVFCGILQQDAQAQLILMELSAVGLTQQVRERLRTQLSPAAAQRIWIWPKQPPDRFAALLQNVDVLLESFPFGSLNTLMMALAAGTPIVTWPGNFVRGRYAQTLLQQVECPELIADSAEAYVEIAVRVAQDIAWKKRIRRKFSLFEHRLFENRLALTAVQDLFLQLAQPS